MARFLLATVLFLIIAAPTPALELALRQRVVVTGPIVTLGDVVQFDGVASGPRGLPPQLARTPLTPAPAPGTQTYLQAARIRDLLAAKGVDASQMRLSGADVVAISSQGAQRTQTRFITTQYETYRPDAGAPTDANAPSTHLERLSMEEVLGRAVESYLIQQSGHPDWGVELDLGDHVRQQLASLPGRPDISGGRTPWTGRQRFQVSWVIPSSRTTNKPIPFYARVGRLRQAVTAVRAIEKGDLIRRSDVEVQMVDRALPTQAIRSLNEVVGKEARQSIRQESMLTDNQVREPLMVRRGETVTVFARAQGVVARTTGVAKQDGSQGDLVRVDVAGAKQQLSAHVSGYRELDVLATAAEVSDDASAARRPTSQLR